jgi:LacI family transcriptional regulator
VRLRDVATAAGVSESVASRALSGYTDVSVATRERVGTVARALGYRASARARSLAAGRSASVRCAVVILGASAAQFGRSLLASQLFFGLLAQATAEQLEVSLHSVPQVGRQSYQSPTSDESQDAFGRLDALAVQGSNGHQLPERVAPPSLASLVAEDRADGYLLLSPGEIRPEHLAPLEEAGVPFVLVNRHFEHMGEHPVHCSTIDFASATRSTVERLYALGHRRLALLLPEGSSSTLCDHIRGWEAGLAATGIHLHAGAAPIVRYVRDGEHRLGAHAAARRLLQDAPPTQRPTAIACFNDYCASGVLRAAAALGLRVPEDVSVIGFDNLVARDTTPPLCSYECHIHEVAAGAVRLLCQALRGEASTPQRLVHTPDFVCRGTCGPAPST